MHGRSLRLFLVDGTPNGLLTAEIMNWTGHILSSPRSRLSELIRRPECQRTGIYFLTGPNPDNSDQDRVYIGESDDVARRLKRHNQAEDQGGKDFWERVCLVTSKDQNLTKSHVKYLESILIRHAADSGRYVLDNAVTPELQSLPESDLADMAYFAGQIRLILPVLGLDFLRPTMPVTNPVPSLQPEAVSASSASPRFQLNVPRRKELAFGIEVDDEFVVQAGSFARGAWEGTERGYGNLYRALCNRGVLSGLTAAGLRQFTKDHAFSSPSAAAATVCGRSANGRRSWTTADGMSYQAWQEQLIAAVL